MISIWCVKSGGIASLSGFKFYITLLLYEKNNVGQVGLSSSCKAFKTQRLRVWCSMPMYNTSKIYFRCDSFLKVY